MCLAVCRKLALTGWVMLIDEDFEQARVLIALLVSIIFLALHLVVRPLRRAEDGVLMMLVELALVFIYTSIRLIKSCDESSELCAARLASALRRRESICCSSSWGSQCLSCWLPSG